MVHGWGHDSNALGWNRGSQVRAWTSRSQEFTHKRKFSADEGAGLVLLDGSGKEELRALRKETIPALFSRESSAWPASGRARRLRRARPHLRFAETRRRVQSAARASLTTNGIWQGGGPVQNRLEETLARACRGLSCYRRVGWVLCRRDRLSFGALRGFLSRLSRLLPPHPGPDRSPNAG